MQWKAVENNNKSFVYFMGRVWKETKKEARLSLSSCLFLFASMYQPVNIWMPELFIV
jgi:hypothetical protein